MSDSQYVEPPVDDEDEEDEFDVGPYTNPTKEQLEEFASNPRISELFARHKARMDKEYAEELPRLIAIYKEMGPPDTPQLRALYDAISPQSPPPAPKPPSDAQEPPPFKGGPDSGFRNHGGRPGLAGGSVPDDKPNVRDEEGP